MRLFPAYLNFTFKTFLKFKTFFISTSIRMVRKSLKFGDKKINRSNFYKKKKAI